MVQKCREIGARFVDVPVLLQDGWQDLFVEPMLEQYECLRRRGVEVGLTIGPWTHVGAATQGVGALTAEALDWLAELDLGAYLRPLLERRIEGGSAVPVARNSLSWRALSATSALRSR